MESGSPVVRDEHSRPGEMIYMDIKKLGRIEVVLPHNRRPVPNAT
jgi:hypothetical protein